MSRIHISTACLADWKSRLADPEKHWKRGRSAFELAVSWELARQRPSQMPVEVEAILRTTPGLGDPVLLLAVAEHKVPLPHGRRESQNDLWVLVQTKAGVLSLAIEGKAGEDFDVTVNEWLAKQDPKSTREQRLAYLVDTLGITADVSGLRYQLFHRTVSAIIEAKRFGTKYAAMVVQSFKNPSLLQKQRQQFEDFSSFCSVLGASGKPGELLAVRSNSAVPLFLGWVDSSVATDEQVNSFPPGPGVIYPKRPETGGPRRSEPMYSGTYTPPAHYKNS